MPALCRVTPNVLWCPPTPAPPKRATALCTLLRPHTWKSCVPCSVHHQSRHLPMSTYVRAITVVCPFPASAPALCPQKRKGFFYIPTFVTFLHKSLQSLTRPRINLLQVSSAFGCGQWPFLRCYPCPPLMAPTAPAAPASCLSLQPPNRTDLSAFAGAPPPSHT